jgi:hypothetical protein
MEYFHILHEDVRIMTFACRFENDASKWYGNLGKKLIYSLFYVIKVFLKHWDPHYE